MKSIRWILTFLFLSLALAQTVQACPNCKGAVAAHGSMALGFAWSIALMLAMPALIVAAWAIMLYRFSRMVNG